MLKLGRKARVYNPAVAGFGMVKAMLRAAPMPPLLPKLDQCAHLPPDLGMMLNDQLGCCTCAGFYHSIQVITDVALGYAVTEPDAYVQQLYQEVGGYRPGDPSSDNGAVEQDVLTHLMRYGAPMQDGTRHPIVSYVEIDTRNLDDVCEAIQEFGYCYIGFAVMREFMFSGPTNVWDDNPVYVTPDGGHAVILTGYDRTDPANPVFNVVSWGTRQWKMTAAFFRKFVDEAYAIVDPWWIQKTGRTPFGLTLETLQGLGNALRGATAATVTTDPATLEAARHGVARSVHWPRVEREFREANPACAACGSTEGVQVHHCFDFHEAVLLGRPDLELDPRNLITLCEGPLQHHLLIGHLDDFRSYNPAVREDVLTFAPLDALSVRVSPIWRAKHDTRPKPWDEWTEEQKQSVRADLDEQLPPDPTLTAKYGFTIKPFTE